MDTPDEVSKQSNRYLWIHRAGVLVAYIVAVALSYSILLIPSAHKDFIVSLSSAAILATFGSAIATIGSLWTGDYMNRVLLNVDILFRDIFKHEPWRRWPFLVRSGKKKLFGGNIQNASLHNPEIPMFVGSHHIVVSVPTVQDDFFDLPLFRNLGPLVRFSKAENTTVVLAPPNTPFEKNQLKPMQQYMAYECLLDTWWSVLMFRIARYVVHFGAALTISSAVLGGAAALGSSV